MTAIYDFITATPIGYDIRFIRLDGLQRSNQRVYWVFFNVESFDQWKSSQYAQVANLENKVHRSTLWPQCIATSSLTWTT